MADARMNDLDRMRLEGMEFLSNLGPLVEILTGYRSKLIEQDFSEGAAEDMVVHLHEVMVRNLMSS